MLEIGSIDMNVVQTYTRNTPLLMLLKVIEKDGPGELEVAGNHAPAAAYLNIFCRLILHQLP